VELSLLESSDMAGKNFSVLKNSQ